MGSGDYDVDMLRGVVVILSTTKCKENQCSVSQPGHTVSQVVSEGSGAAEALFRCELRTASWSICLRHVLRSCALDDFQERKVFTVHTGAGACNGASCFQAPRSALDVLWFPVELVLPFCIYIHRSAMPVKSWRWIPVLPSSECAGRLMCQERSVREARLRWEALGGAGPGWWEGHSGNMKVSRTCAEQSCRPRRGWKVGRRVIEKVGRGHVRNGLGGTGSQRWAWSRRMRTDLRIRRSPWWPELLEVRPRVWFMAECSLGLGWRWDAQSVVNGCHRQASLSFEASSLGPLLSSSTYITETLFGVI